MAVVQWDEDFEDTPAGGDAPSGGDDRIRELKNTTRSIVDKEHVIDHDAASVPAIAAQGWHREGSAVAYYQAAAPTNRPDGATALDTDDDGRLWIDSDDGTLDYWDGDSFEDLKVPEVDITRGHLDKSADYTLLDGDVNVVFVTTGASDVTVTLPTAADNSDRIVTVKKVDDGAGTVIIDGEGAETIDGETTVVISAQYGVWRGYCDATEWHTLVPLTDQALQTTDDVEFNDVTVSGSLIGLAAVQVASGGNSGTNYSNASSYLPNVGDVVLATGQATSGSSPLPAVKLERTNASTLTLSYINTSGGISTRTWASGGVVSETGARVWILAAIASS